MFNKHLHKCYRICNRSHAGLCLKESLNYCLVCFFCFFHSLISFTEVFFFCFSCSICYHALLGSPVAVYWLFCLTSIYFTSLRLPFRISVHQGDQCLYIFTWPHPQTAVSHGATAPGLKWLWQHIQGLEGFRRFPQDYSDVFVKWYHFPNLYVEKVWSFLQNRGQTNTN